ncbi:hypothetical protein [Prosthecobacter sp.]|uniref:hypothetical protein n=1 Tax=Prosthecobacter sp. TaxID=1965333 RepID=UPI001D6B3B9F|nr:hypothetical protein [Prosthecobacter sp.]MCB1278990.1 hypothetical protein [Prosthecobacter sp.]
MKHVHAGLTLLAAALLPGCSVLSDSSPPKTTSEIQAEALSGQVPDNVRDPRPQMPPMGPLGMPMR